MSGGAQELYRWMRWRGGRNRQLWWGQSKIAAELRISLRTLARWLKELVQAGVVEAIRRGPRSNLYNLKVVAVENGRSFGRSFSAVLLPERTTVKMKSRTPPQ